MPLTASSTLTDALAQANNSGQWRFAQGTQLAKDRLEALEWLNVNRPSSSAHSGSTMSFPGNATEVKELHKFLKAAVVRRTNYTRGRAIF